MKQKDIQNQYVLGADPLRQEIMRLNSIGFQINLNMLENYFTNKF